MRKEIIHSRNFLWWGIKHLQGAMEGLALVFHCLMLRNKRINLNLDTESLVPTAILTDLQGTLAAAIMPG